MASIPKRSAVERAARAMRPSLIAPSAACIRRAMPGASSGSQTHRQRLERGVGEGIVTARKDKAIRGGVEGPHVVAPAQETHALRHAGGARLPCEAGLFP